MRSIRIKRDFATKAQQFQIFTSKETNSTFRLHLLPSHSSGQTRLQTLVQNPEPLRGPDPRSKIHPCLLVLPKFDHRRDGVPSPRAVQLRRRQDEQERNLLRHGVRRTGRALVMRSSHTDRKVPKSLRDQSGR